MMGGLWVSHTYKGLYKLDLSGDLGSAETRFYDTSDGLPSNISINVAKIRGAGDIYKSGGRVSLQPGPGSV